MDEIDVVELMMEREREEAFWEEVGRHRERTMTARVAAGGTRLALEESEPVGAEGQRGGVLRIV